MVFYCFNVFEYDDVFVVGCGYDDVGVFDGFFDGDYVEVFYYGL